MAVKYEIRCKGCGNVYEVLDDKKEAKAKARRYFTQRLTCEKCGKQDWKAVEAGEEG